MKTRRIIPALLALAALTSAAHAQTRLKDIAAVQGVRGNQLVGYGLVVGLDGSGDGTGATFTPQSVASMLQKFGVTVPPGALKLKNVAAVMVTATLPPFVKNGSAIDVTVSSLGDAKSLAGRDAAANAAASGQRPSLCRRAGRAFGRRVSGRRRRGRQRVQKLCHRGAHSRRRIGGTGCADDASGG